MFYRKLTFISFFVLALIGHAQPAIAAPQFSTNLPGEMRWSQLTDIGTLLVGGKGYLTHVDTESGEPLWSRTDLGHLAPFNVRPVAGSPYLVISEQVGKIPPKSRLQMLDVMTGETLWDTGQTLGNNLAGFPIPQKQLVLFVRDITGVKGKKPGAYLSALQMASGDLIWETRIGAVSSLPTHAMNDSGFIPALDLSGHPDPIVHEDQFILIAHDIRSFDLNSGALNWHYKLKGSHPQLKRTYAQPIVDENRLVATSKDSIVALSLASGQELWRQKISKAPLPQIISTDSHYLVRLGGTFSNGKKLIQQKPFGVAAITKEGKLDWQWKKGKHSITNLVEHENRVAAADKQRLYVFDINGKGKPAVTRKLEFKRKMGKAEVAAKSLGAVGGFLSGGLAGAAKGVGGGDRSDPPLDITKVGDQIVVRGQHHVLAYNMTSDATPWSVQFAPPGMNPFALMAMGAVTAGASLGNASGVWGSSSYATRNAFASSTTQINKAYQDAASRRFAQSERAGTLAFFLTQEKGAKKLVGLDLASGETVGAIAMNEKSPHFMVDQDAGRVFYFPGKREVQSISY